MASVGPTILVPSAGVITNAMLAGDITLAKLASIAANTTLGNNTGSAAAPIALTAALENANLDQSVVLHKAVFSAVTSVTIATWAADTYRRIEIICRVNSGTAGDLKIGPVGLAAGSQYTTLAANAATGAWVQDNAAAADTFEIQMAALPQTVWAEMNISPVTAGRHMHGTCSRNDSSQIRFAGITVDVTNAITGLVVTFAGGACSGHLEVRGYV